MPRRFLASFLPSHQPWITRQSYRHELVTALTYPAAVALLDGGVIGILAAKAFHVSEFLFAAIVAAPNFANLTSFVWAWLARGRRKVRFINLLQFGVLACVGLIALLPTTGWGPLLLTLLIVVSRCLLAGIVTIRSNVWRHNYPRAVRATVTGRLTNVQALVIAIAPLAGYAVLDPFPHAFPLVYLAGLLIGLIGTAAFGKVRMRGEQELLRYERTPAARPQPHGTPGAIYEYDPAAQQTVSMWQVLRRDHFFRRYMLWQFVAGGANMMGETVLIYLVATMTRAAAVESYQYTLSILLTNTIPMALTVVTMGYWARRLDRTHIARFRATQSWLWIADQATNWFGALMGLPVLALARVIQGASRSAGILAWNLGHNDFASRNMVAVYMGLHVTLTGIRGAFVPFLALGLYAGWDAHAIGRTGLTLPAFPGLGAHVFLITTGLMVLSNLGFTALAREMGARAADA